MSVSAVLCRLSMIWMHCGQGSFISVTCEVHSRKVQWKSPPAPASHSVLQVQLCAQLPGQLGWGTDAGKNKPAKESGFVRWNFLITKGHCCKKNHSKTSFIPIQDAFAPGYIVPGLPRAPQFTLPDALDNVSVLNER